MNNTKKFNLGEPVRIRPAFPPGHVRTPYFVRGHQGIIESFCGIYPNPEERAYGRDGKPDLALYRVSIEQTNLWADYSGTAKDKLLVDIFEHWLEPIK